MIFHGRPAGRRSLALGLPVALVTLAAGAAGFASPAGSAISTAGGRAVGESVSVSLFGAPPTTSGPLPSVEVPPAGGDLNDASTSASVHTSEPQAPFAGRYLETAGLSVSSRVTADLSGATSTSGAASVSALGGALSVAQLSSTCSSSAGGSAGSTKVTGGSLVLSASQTVVLPSDPAPNTTYAGYDRKTGAAYKVVLNEQDLMAKRITVNAVHIVLTGPAAGDIVIAQSSCGPPPPPKVPPRPTPTKTPPPPTSTKPTPPSSAVPKSKASAVPAAKPAAAAAAVPQVGAADRVAAPARTQAAALPGIVPTAVPAVSGGAYGFYTSVALGGGPAIPKGPSPTVTLPAAGADPPLTATEPTGNATFGPAAIYESKEMKVSTQGTTGATGSATSSASATAVGPGPLKAGSASSTCKSDGAAQTASTSITDGKLTVSQGPNKDLDETDDVITTVPASPPPNTKFEGQLENVGDSFRAVFNEQQVTADAITVNAIHLYLLGPFAIGELVIAQSRCGRTATSAGTGTNGGGTNGTGTNGTGTNGGGTNGGGTNGTGSGTGASGTGAAGSSGKTGSAARDPLAKTGIDPPFLLGFALLALGSAASVAARFRRRATAAGDLRSVSRSPS